MLGAQTMEQGLMVFFKGIKDFIQTNLSLLAA
jgi:hypothetical protein